MRPSVIILDCDGTLVDSQRHIADVFNATLADFGHEPLPADAVYQVIGLSLPDALRRLLPRESDDLRERLVHAYRARYATLPGGDPLYAGVRDFLAAAHAGGRWMAMATGKSRAGALRVVAEHALDRYFISIKTGDLCRPKPDPDMINQILDETGLAPERALMIGDTTFDVEMARAAGVRAVAVTCGAHGCDVLAASGAELVIPNLVDLEPHLDRLLPP